MLTKKYTRVPKVIDKLMGLVNPRVILVFYLMKCAIKLAYFGFGSLMQICFWTTQGKVGLFGSHNCIRLRASYRPAANMERTIDHIRNSQN